MSANHVENPQQRWLPCLTAPGSAVRQSSWSGVAANWKNPKCRLEAVVAGRRDICAAAWNLLCLGWLRDYTGWPLVPKMTPHHATTSLNELLNQALFAWIPASVTHMLWNSFHTYFSCCQDIIFYRASLNFVQSTSIRRVVLGSHPVFKSLPHCRQLEEVGARCWQLSAQEVRPVSKERGVRAVCKKRCPLPCQSAPSSGRR